MDIWVLLSLGCGVRNVKVYEHYCDPLTKDVEKKKEVTKGVKRRTNHEMTKEKTLALQNMWGVRYHVSRNYP